MVNVAVLGYGTVGSGVVEVLLKNNSHLSRRAGEEVNLKYVLDLRDFPGDPVEKILVHDFQTIVNDPEIRVIAEAMGGIEPAYSFAKAALEKGISFCTSNKELVEAKGAELIELAKENNANFFFEASVGGGIPVIRPMFACLTADHFDEISGILNGTTNYILTKMDKEGLAFPDVLKEAQDKGYAERNPEADVEGHDAGRKIAILASLANEKQVSFADIPMEGITKITSADFAYAKALDASIKLLGTERKKDGKTYAMVAPFLVHSDDPLYAVDGVFNAVKLHGDMLGNVMFYGKGAGKHATASAVVSDIVSAAKNPGRHVPILWSQEKLQLADAKEYPFRFLVRLEGEADTAAFGSVEAVKAEGVTGETAFVTEEMTEKKLEEAIAASGASLIHRIRLGW